MKLTRRFVYILYAILACVVCGVLLLLSAENARTQINGVPKSQLSSSIPFNPKITLTDKDKAFGAFAWQAFVALNWPADCNGEPLKDKQIGQAPDKPRVWEFYNFPEDVFKPNGEKPKPQPVVPPQCLGSGDHSRSVEPNLRLTEFASESNVQPDKLESNPSLTPLLVGHKPLVDRKGNYILNEVRMNPVEVEQIVGNGWYDAANLKYFNDKDNPFTLMCSHKDKSGIYPNDKNPKIPCSANKLEGTIELKAAWMVLDSVPNEFSSKYYTTTQTFYMETPESIGGNKTKVEVPMALVGFHLVQKTSKQAWIWATFEHIDNVPDDKTLQKPEDGKHYNLYSSDCTKTEICEPNTPYVKEPYLWRNEFPHAVTKTETGEIKEQTPSQITRLVSIPEFAQSLNKEWQGKLKEVSGTSVWKNYQLIGVQWLENPYVPYKLEPGGRGVTPPYLANVTLEPYVQKDERGKSCIACHTRATLPPGVHADFSYLLSPDKPNFKFLLSPDKDVPKE